MIPAPLAAMSHFNQWINWIAIPDPAKPGKNKKIPINPTTAQAADAHNPINWMPAAQAYENAARLNCGVGFTFTAQDPFFFIDIDNCLETSGQWSPLAQYLLGQFNGCAVELSDSRTGLHIFGVSPNPGHHKKKRQDLGLEFYTSKRFAALGGHEGMVGDSGVDHSHAVAGFIANYMPAPIGEAGQALDWTDEPDPEWSGPSDDDQLIQRMVNSKGSARAAFGETATFKQLWEADADVLGRIWPDPEQGREFDYSNADAALFSHLAFWTGKDCERMKRLGERSALYREKWEARQPWLFDEITNAAGRCNKVYRQPDAIEQPASVNPAPVNSGSGTPDLKEGHQYLAVDQQLEHFKGCVYVRGRHRVFTPDGDLLQPDRFKATYGGYVFALDSVGRTTSKNAFEVFTESQAVRWPKAHAICFRPQELPGAVLKEEGRRLINTYVPADIVRTKGDAGPFLDLLARMMPDTRDREIYLSYIAAVVQYPGVKFQWCPVVQGAEGNGKSWLVEAIIYAVGKRYSHKPSRKQLGEKATFNAWIEGKLFIAVEEIWMKNNADIANELKDKITDSWLEMEGKGADQVMMDNMANWLMGSNHKDGVLVIADGRRYAPIFTAQQTLEDIIRDGMGGDYFPKLYSWLRSGGGNQILAEFLSTYPINAEFNPAGLCQRAPETSSTAEAVELSLGGVEQEILEVIEEGRPGFAGGFVSSIALAKLLTAIKKDKAVPPNKRLDLMQKLGYEIHPCLHKGRLNTSTSIDGGRPRLYIRREHIVFNLSEPVKIKDAYVVAQQLTGDETAAALLNSVGR